MLGRDLFPSQVFKIMEHNLIGKQLYPDQIRHLVGPDLDPVCLPRANRVPVVCKIVFLEMLFFFNKFVDIIGVLINLDPDQARQVGHA